jgi:hypothetical protein
MYLKFKSMKVPLNVKFYLTYFKFNLKQSQKMIESLKYNKALSIY